MGRIDRFREKKDVKNIFFADKFILGRNNIFLRTGGGGLKRGLSDECLSQLKKIYNSISNFKKQFH